MRYALVALLAAAALAQAPRALAVPPVIGWCVSSPGHPDVCSADEERILASVRKRLAGGEGWDLGQQLTITRVQ